MAIASGVNWNARVRVRADEMGVDPVKNPYYPRPKLSGMGLAAGAGNFTEVTDP